MRNILLLPLKRPLLTLLLAALLTVFCAASVSRTKINYDMTRYLAPSTMTRRTMDIISAEFAPASQVLVMFRDTGDGAGRDYADRLGALDGVLFSEHSTRDGTEAGKAAFHLVTLTMRDEAAAADALDRAPAILAGTEYTLGGALADLRALKTQIGSEIPRIFLIAVAIVLGVLLLTSSAWAEPALFIIVLGVSIIVNMGTNWIFPSISFITFAVAAILQLALSMDYSIMLLKHFNLLRAQGIPVKEAAGCAAVQTAAAIASSALTTVAGLLSLTFMSFTMGYDIGVVLSKGIFISMLTVFLLMPPLLVLFSRLLERTAHRELPMRGAFVSRAAGRCARPLSAALLLLIAAGTVLQDGNTYTFLDAGVSMATQSITDIFGGRNQMALVFPRADTDADYEKQSRLIASLRAMTPGGRPFLNKAYAMVTIGAPAVTFYTAAEAAELTGMDAGAVSLFFTVMGFKSAVRGDKLIQAAARLLPDNAEVRKLYGELEAAQKAFNGARHSRILLDVNLENGGSMAHAAIEGIRDLLEGTYGSDTGMAGIAVSGYEIAAAFTKDLRTISLLTAAAIFLILLATFHSFLIPAVLVGVIQGAVFINMAINRVAGEPVFFMCYLICIAIQMGATVDYAIVYTANYRQFRKNEDRDAALTQAVAATLPTVITSGLIMAVAGFTIGCVSSVYYISSIGILLGRGVIVSVALVLFLLPGLLYLLDRHKAGGAGRNGGGGHG